VGGKFLWGGESWEKRVFPFRKNLEENSFNEFRSNKGKNKKKHGKNRGLGLKKMVKSGIWANLHNQNFSRRRLIW